MISWACRELQERTARITNEGPDGAPAGTTHTDGCEMALPMETTPDSALLPLSRGCGEVWHPTRPWQRWERTKAGGRGQPWSLTAPLASEAANDMLSPFSSSSLRPNKTRSLTLAEGRWSGWEKRTGETSQCGESEARGLWADVSLLSAVHWDPLPCCFFLTGPCEEENRRAQGVESLSEKKAIRESKEARLIFRLPGSVRDEVVVVVAEGEDIWVPMLKRPLIKPDGSAHSGGPHRHRLVQHRRAISSFLTHCTNQWPSSFTAWLNKASVRRKKRLFP